MKFEQWLGFLSLLGALLILWQIRQLLLLLFAAVVVANALNHAANWLQRKRIHRGGAIALAVTGLLGFLSLFFILIIPPFFSQLKELVTLVPQGLNQVIVWVKSILAQADPDLIHSLPNLQQLSQQFQPLLNQLAGQGLNLFYSTLGFPLSFLLLLVLSLMLLADPLAYRQGFLRLLPAFYRQRGDHILTLCEEALEDWLVAILVNMGVVVVLTFIGLGLLQIPLTLALALLAGLLTFIPFWGPLMSLIPALAIAFLDNPFKALLVLGLYLIIHQLANQIITPRLIAKPPALLPGSLLLGQVIFASLFNILGLLLAYPLSIVSQVLLREIVIRDILDGWQNHSAYNLETSQEDY